jgi:hypothetical protein
MRPSVQREASKHCGQYSCWWVYRGYRYCSMSSLRKAVPIPPCWRQGERRYSSYSLPQHWMSGRRHAPAALYTLERTPGTHWIGDWVGLSWSGHRGYRKNPLPETEPRSSSLWSVTILTELPRLLQRQYVPCTLSIVYGINNVYNVSQPGFVSVFRWTTTWSCYVLRSVKQS